MRLDETVQRETLISKLSREMSRTVAIAARQTLEQVTPMGGRGRANVLAAVKKAGGNDADRRVLQGLAYGWKKGRQIQERVFIRVLGLLARLAPARAKSLRELFWTKDGEVALRDVLMTADWAEPASPLEVWLMTRRLTDEVPREIHSPVQGRVPVLRKNLSVASQIDAFEEWADEHGHGKWVKGPALGRALGPLVSQARTRGVLPGWDDLRPEQQQRYVYLSLEREKMMLGSRPLHIRAMQRFQSPDAIRLASEEDAAIALISPEPSSVLRRCENCYQRYRLTQEQRVCLHCGAPPSSDFSA